MSKKTWMTEGFEAFRRGTFGNGGQNLYVSKKGVLQRIFQYDLNRDGYVDLVFANCQDHCESAQSYAYSLADGKRAELPGQGSVCGMVLDIDGDGYEDIVIAGRNDAAAPYASTDIYFGSPEGYSQKYHTRIPTPFTEDCTYGDFTGCGKPMLVFAMPIYPKLRIFTQTDIGLEWSGFVDLPITAHLVAACDLDGDGYDDLICRKTGETATVVYWGGKDGINTERKTELPEFPASDILQPEEEKTLQSDMERKYDSPRLLQSVKWAGRNCFTLSTGKKMIFFSANRDRQLERVLELDVPMALAAAVGDLDGDGLDDIAIASLMRDINDPRKQNSYIVWNSAEGVDKRPRTAIETSSACHVHIKGGKLAFAQCSEGKVYTNDSLLFENGDFTHPRRFESEDARRCAIVINSDGTETFVVVNHYSRSAIGCDESYVYYGGPDGYDPERREVVGCHCGVDAMIADLDDDGYAELILANNSENSIHLDVGHHIHYWGPNGYEPERTRYLKANVGWGVTAGDIDHDGYLEIVTPANKWRSIRVFRGRDDYNTWYDIDLPEGCTSRWPSMADINNDGWLDLFVTVGTYTERSYILWGGPEGFSFERSTPINVPNSINVTFADLTKNGYLDVIVGSHTQTPRGGRLYDINPHHSFVHIYWNGPDGLSESRKAVFRADAADSFAIADFNNDGWLDVFVGSYHGGKDRDINSFLYWNREGQFRELDRDLLYAHSASGCMAADFNEDSYIDLALANHKIDGDHTGFSSVWWNGPDGFDIKHQTHLPTKGPHGMISTEIGNIMDRSGDEHYYSEPYTITEDGHVAAITTDGEIPPKTSVTAHVRVNGGEWTAPEGVSVNAGDILEYRLTLSAVNCLRTPRITKVCVELE